MQGIKEERKKGLMVKMAFGALMDPFLKLRGVVLSAPFIRGWKDTTEWWYTGEAHLRGTEAP